MRIYVNPQVTETLYNSFVKSKLELSASIWSTYYMSKAFLGLLDKNIPTPKEVYARLTWLNSLAFRRTLDQLIICYRWLNWQVTDVQRHILLCMLFVSDRPKYEIVAIKYRAYILYPPLCHNTIGIVNHFLEPVNHLHALG